MLKVLNSDPFQHPFFWYFSCNYSIAILLKKVSINYQMLCTDMLLKDTQFLQYESDIILLESLGGMSGAGSGGSSEQGVGTQYYLSAR